MQTPKQITPRFAPETRFDIEPRISPAHRQIGVFDDPAMSSLRKRIEIPKPRGVTFSALNDYSQQLARFTGLIAGTGVALCITFEAPLSGMSMNPARTFGSAILSHLWSSLWFYLVAPPHASGCNRIPGSTSQSCLGQTASSSEQKTLYFLRVSAENEQAVGRFNSKSR